MFVPVGGYASVNNLVTMLKSLLFHYRGELHFHFVTDAQAQRVLPRLMGSWDVPGGELFFFVHRHHSHTRDNLT